VINYLKSRLNRFYEYVDIINEPGSSSMYHAGFLFESARKVQADKLTRFFNLVISRLPELTCKIIVEPFNYDVS
jgi:hypothetical protein